jgi:hypothetical protein
VQSLSHLTSCIPIKSYLYFAISFATVMSEPALCRLLTIHVPTLMPILLSFCRLSKESVQVRGLLWHFVTTFFLRRGVVSLTPNSQAGEPSLVGYPVLLIQCILSYPPYLEAVSSIRNLRTRHAVVTRDPPNMENIKRPSNTRFHPSSFSTLEDKLWRPTDSHDITIMLSF